MDHKVNSPTLSISDSKHFILRKKTTRYRKDRMPPLLTCSALLALEIRSLVNGHLQHHILEYLSVTSRFYSEIYGPVIISAIQIILWQKVSEFNCIPH